MSFHRLPPHQAVEAVLGEVRRGEVSVDRMRPWAERIVGEDWIPQCAAMAKSNPYFEIPMQLFQEVVDRVAEDAKTKEG